MPELIENESSEILKGELTEEEKDQKVDQLTILYSSQKEINRVCPLSLLVIIRKMKKGMAI